MTYNIYMVGVGGQGVLSIAELITEAAFLGDVPVNYYPTEGMAQRGGFVKAQIRLGRHNVGPHISEKDADLVIAMEVSEALKAVKFCKPGGYFLLWGHIWLPAASLLGKQGYPALEDVQSQISQSGANLVYLDPNNLPMYNNSPVSDNLYVLGAASGTTSLGELIQPQIMREAIKNRWPKSVNKNLYAFDSGAQSVLSRSYG